MIPLSERSLTKTILIALHVRTRRAASSHSARNALGFNSCAFSMIISGDSPDAACCNANTRTSPRSSLAELNSMS